MSPRNKKAPVKPLRRKAERKSETKPAKKVFLLTVDAQQMRVEYTPNYFDGQGHFEFRSPHSPACGIPVSETGYLSHFAPMIAIEAGQSVEAFARQIVDAIFAERSRGKRQRIDDAQISLF